MLNNKEGFISTEEMQPTETGIYEVSTGIKSEPVGEVIYDVNRGWLIPRLIKSFYKVEEWRPRKEAC